MPSYGESSVSIELESIQPVTDRSFEILGPVLRRETFSDKCKDVFTMKTVVLCVVFAAVLVVFLVPIVIYTLPQEYTGDECDELLDDCNYSGVSTNTSPGSNTSLVCSEGFYISLEDISNGTTVEVCRPECGEWEEFPHSTVVALYVTKTVAGVIYMISGAVVLVLSVMRYKQMFTFPSVFIIYSILSAGVIELLFLIAKVDQETLFCTSQNLMESLDDPTNFCTLSGAIYAYFALLTILFWLCHVSAVCWGVKFPFHYSNIKQRGYIRYIHIGMVLVALLLPWVPVGITLGTGGFTITGFPPSTCFPKATETVFYAFYLPDSILNAVGISLIAVIIQELCLVKWRRNNAFKGQDGNTSSLKTRSRKQHLTHTIGTREIKLLIIFICYFVIALCFLVGFTIDARNGPEFTDDLKNYFACEETGTSPGKSCSRPLDRLDAAALFTIQECLSGLYPIVNLIYVVNIKELKLKFSKCRAQLTAHC